MCTQVIVHHQHSACKHTLVHRIKAIEWLGNNISHDIPHVCCITLTGFVPIHCSCIETVLIFEWTEPINVQNVRYCYVMHSFSLSQWWSVVSSGGFSSCVFVRRRRGGRAAGRRRGSSRRTHTTHMLPKPCTQSLPTAGNPTLYDALMEMYFLLWVHTHCPIHAYLLKLIHIYWRAGCEINGAFDKKKWQKCHWNLKCDCKRMPSQWIPWSFFFFFLA